MSKIISGRNCAPGDDPAPQHYYLFRILKLQCGSCRDSLCLSIALEFMEHGSLHDVIVEAKDAPNLTLDVVFDIALDVLQA